jgi:hypothetical protein
VVEVSTVGGSASDVSVALTAQPSSQKPTFTSGCAKDGTASCTLSSVTVKAPVVLHAQIAVASSASSVSSVKLTATASVVTTAKWTPPAANETVTVTAATASPAASSSASPEAVNLVPLGPIPDLNGESSKLIGPGDAASLFPAITPSPTPRPTAGHHRLVRKPTVHPIPTTEALLAGTPALTAQAAGLIALGLAIILVVTHLSMRKRSRSSGPDS